MAALSSPLNWRSRSSAPAGNGPSAEVAVSIPQALLRTEMGTDTAATMPKRDARSASSSPV